MSDSRREVISGERELENSSDQSGKGKSYLGQESVHLGERYNTNNNNGVADRKVDCYL